MDLKLNSESGGDTSTFISNGEWDLVGKTRPPLDQEKIKIINWK